MFVICALMRLYLYCQFRARPTEFIKQDIELREIGLIKRSCCRWKRSRSAATRSVVARDAHSRAKSASARARRLASARRSLSILSRSRSAAAYRWSSRASLAAFDAANCIVRVSLSSSWSLAIEVCIAERAGALRDKATNTTAAFQNGVPPTVRMWMVIESLTVVQGLTLHRMRRPDYGVCRHYRCVWARGDI